MKIQEEQIEDWLDVGDIGPHLQDLHTILQIREAIAVADHERYDHVDFPA
jgi:hypothetical protein